MKTMMQFEAMEKALPYVVELMECKELKQFKDRMKDTDGVSNGEMMMGLMPVFLKKKPQAVFGMLGALVGKTADEVAEQDWEETKQLMKNPIINDLFDFFIFSVRMARNA